MSEPTKENRDRAVFIAAQFSRDYLYAHRIEPPALAKLIAAVRAEAHNDALASAAAAVDACGDYYGKARIHECAVAIDDLRVKV